MTAAEGRPSEGEPDRAGPAPVPERFGAYKVEHEIGRGGMGIVYLARDPQLGRRVAIKVLSPELAGDPDRLTRLGREARALAALNHPNIATIYGMEEDPGHGRFLVLEWIAGQTLAERLESGPLPPAEALAVTRQVADALAAAHAEGVVHRDIKPRNVVLAAGGRVKVLDFGLARRVESAAWGESAASDADERFSSMTDGSGAAMGTASYMSPERILGEREDHRSDVFSLGCVLYECLSGRRAFAGATRFGALAAALGARPDLDALGPDTPAAVRDLVAACLRRRPEDRPQTMRDVLAAMALAADDLASPRAVHAPAAGASHLPAERTSFIGRAKDLASCARLLEDTRLLTLTGIGGCGKTRLALRLAMKSLARFPGGAWFVDLASLKDADRVALTMATTLGVREEPGTPLIETLIRRVREQPILIVLDNCEHVIDAAARLADALLAATRQLKLVVTSREGLGIDGERTFSLRSLSVPQPTADLEAIEEAESVQLFVQRARMVDPRFEMGTRTAPAVAEICRRLDGIPLAIELAAARVKLLSAAEIRSRLDDRFRLLTGGSKTALPRHQTLRATLQWSEDQLSIEERRLFHLLSVFAGGWTLEAVLQVAGTDVHELETLAVLERLVDKSLVMTERAADRTTRYSMLETVRQYAQERLNENAEGDATRLRHLEYFLALAEEAHPKLVGPELGAWLLRLEPEQENLLSALAWCDRAENGGEKGLRLSTALLRYWTSRGLLALGSSVAREALDREGADARSRHRASALYSAGILAYARGLYDEVGRCWEESLAISRETGDRAGAARATMGLGTVAVARGDRTVARDHFENSIASARESGERQILGAALNGLAELHRVEGDLDGAVPLYEEALALFREQGSFNVAVILLNLAIVGIEQGELVSSRRRLAEVASLAEQEASKFAGWGVLEVTAALASATRHPARAARVWGASGAARARMGRSLAPGDEQFVMPWVERARAVLGDSGFAEAESAGRALSYEDALSEARVWLEVGESATG